MENNALGKSLLTITETAVNRLKDLLSFQARGQPSPIGIRVSVKSRGCSGLSYVLSFAYEINDDEIISDYGITFLVDRLSVFLLAGSEIDFEQDKLQSRFLFKNPNEEGRCGCGESFHAVSRV